MPRRCFISALGDGHTKQPINGSKGEAITVHTASKMKNIQSPSNSDVVGSEALVKIWYAHLLRRLEPWYYSIVTEDDAIQGIEPIFVLLTIPDTKAMCQIRERMMFSRLDFSHQLPQSMGIVILTVQ